MEKTGPKPRPTDSEYLMRNLIDIGEKGCWLWKGLKFVDGYARLRDRRAHRVFYERNIGPIPKGMIVCHNCDVPHCVNPAHLFLGTPKTNLEDMVKKGRALTGKKNHFSKDIYPGSKNSAAKLTEADIPEIFRLRTMGLTYYELATTFNVGRSSIGRVLRREKWKHVDLA
jgi:hypothetical protein